MATHEVNAPSPSPSSDELAREREAVRAASEAGEIFASQPEHERSVGWHLGRRLLRYVLIVGAVTVLAIVLLLVTALFLPAHRHEPRASAASPAPAIP